MDLQHTERRAVAAKYVIAGRIETHGTSRFYRATQADTGRLVALREFVPAEADPRETLKVLTRMSAISSRFLVDLVDAAPMEDQQIYVAHALLDGESLIARLERKKALAPLEAAALGVRMLKGLDSLHRRDLVHGGLRPSRVFHERTRHRGWHIKLLGACVPTLSRDEMRHAPDLVRYAPPEWLAGEPWTMRSDVWCAAVILYEAMAAQSPYGAGAADAVAQRILAGEAATFPGTVKDLPDDFARLVAEGLSRDPEARPPNASEMLNRLLALFPEPERKSSGNTAAREHWTQGRMVGRPGVGALALPPAQETRTTIARKQRNAVKRASATAAVVTASCAAALLVGLYLRAQRRERELLARLDAEAQQTAALASARQSPSAAGAPTPAALSPIAPPSSAEDAGAPVVVASAAADATAPRAGTAASAQGTAPRGGGGGHARPRSTAGGGSAAVAVREPADTTPDSSQRAPSGPATSASSGLGMLDFRTSAPCSFVLDGRPRGEVATVQLTLAAGLHPITCHRPGSTERLVVRIHPGRLTRVRLTASGETEVYTEDAPSAAAP